MRYLLLGTGSATGQGMILAQSIFAAEILYYQRTNLVQHAGVTKWWSLL